MDYKYDSDDYDSWVCLFSLDVDHTLTIEILLYF